MMLRVLGWSAGLIVGVAVAVAAYAHWPAAPVPPGARADSVLVLKSERRMVLLNRGSVLREYRIALGGDPVGRKSRRGDERTPEGRYRLDYRNPNSIAWRSMHISYPDEGDVRRARARGVLPGGSIMIHGVPGPMRCLGRLHRLVDWTDGCIGVTNDEMDQIWGCVPVGTPIEIRP